MSHLFAPFRSLPRFRELYGDKFTACCPAHDEKTASFRGVLKDGRLLIKCFGCGANARQLLAAMRLPWGVLFEGGKPPNRQARDAAAIVRAAREAETARKMDEYFEIAQDLDERAALLALDWREYEGPETLELLSRLYRDRSYLEWRLEALAGDLKI